MRSFLATIAAATAFLAAALSGCALQHPAATGNLHPNLIVVREFAFSPGVVTLDPSLGFSLNRGEPGVPAERRAESAARAAAFSLADAITQQLTQLGYDAAHIESGGAEPGGRALIVTGAFGGIVEGHRHEGASVTVQAEVDYRAPNGGLQQLSSFPMDSRRVPAGGLVPAPGRLGPDVNYQATLVGAAIGRYVGDLARTDKWPGAAAR